jgi:hypothetical protein
MNYSTLSASDCSINIDVGLRRNAFTLRSNIGRLQRQKRKSLNKKLLKSIHIQLTKLVAKYRQTVAMQQK